MKLDDVSFDVSLCENLTINHPSNNDIVLNLEIRNPLSFEYKSNVGKAYGSVYEKFTDKAEANIILEAVSAIKSWDIDDKKCDLKTMIELFSQSNFEWIAIAVYDRIMAKKLLGMKI